MGQRSNPIGEPWVRQHLVSEWTELRAMFTKTLLEESTECGRYAWDAWTPLIAAAVDGGAVSLHRFELPPDHPMGPPHGGHPCDSLELGADDVLRPVVSPGLNGAR